MQPATITVVKGDNVTLVCEAEGSPTPTITWKRVDTYPLPDGSMIHRVSKLMISNYFNF